MHNLHKHFTIYTNSTTTVPFFLTRHYYFDLRQLPWPVIPEVERYSQLSSVGPPPFVQVSLQIFEVHMQCYAPVAKGYPPVLGMKIAPATLDTQGLLGELRLRK